MLSAINKKATTNSKVFNLAYELETLAGARFLLPYASRGGNAHLQWLFSHMILKDGMNFKVSWTFSKIGKKAM